MRQLLQKTGNPVVDEIFSRPFTYNKNIKSVPNYVSSEPAAGQLPSCHPDAITLVECSGNETSVLTAGNDPAISDPCIHCFSDILFYKNMFFDSNGQLLHPSIRVLNADGSAGGGLLCTPFWPVRLGQYYFFTALQPLPEKVQCIEGECVCFSSMVGYGHYLLEHTTQIWPFIHSSKRPKILLNCSFKSIPVPILALLKPFGITPDDCIIPDEIAVLKKVLFPVRAYMHDRYATQEALNIWAAISSYYTRNKTSKKSELPTRIYLSRKKVKKRPLINEEECEHIFRQSGFSVYYLEEMPFEEQVQLVANGTHIAGSIGSAMHNIVFSPRGSSLKVFYLMPKAFPSWRAYARIEGFYKRPFCYTLGDYLPSEKGKKINRDIHGWRIDCAVLKRAIANWLKY